MIHRIFKKQMVIQINIADSTDYLPVSYTHLTLPTIEP